MYLYDNNMLLPWYHKAPISNWEPGDTEYLYQTNLRRLDPDWYYREKPVTYTWNRNGYRCPEWEDIDWANSHIVMGSSVVAGVGVAYEDTLPAWMESMLGEPVINLGYGGGSVYVHMYNAIHLIDNKIKPKSVTFVMPDYARLTYFEQPYPTHMLANSPPDNANLGALYNAWIADSNHSDMFGHMIAKGYEALWQAQGVPVQLVHDWWQDVTKRTDWPVLPPQMDLARDMSSGPNGWYAHPGRLTQRMWAQHIVELLRQKI